MTNEELAVRIQQGEQDLIPKLWHQVVKFISSMARQYLSQKKLRGAYCAAEEDDLVNQAYFGFLTAIKGFNPDKGKFLTYLDLAIRTSFLQATGRYSVPQRLMPATLRNLVTRLLATAMTFAYLTRLQTSAPIRTRKW